MSEQTIASREARIDAMLRVLPEAVFELDRAGRFVSVHGGEIELVAPRDELIGRSYAEVLVAFPQLIQAFDDLLGRAFECDGIANVEYTLRHADGEHIYEARGIAATSDHAIVVVHDVTEARRLLAHLVIADRQRAAAALAGSLLHEIANPISYMLASLDTLCRRIAEGSDASQLATTAREGALRLAEIARDFRMLARFDDATTEADVGETLRRVLRFSELTLTGIKVIVDCANVPKVRIPEGRLGQVLANLFANASHAFAKPPGSIRVRVRDEAPSVVIEIGDEGVGILPENLPRVFDPFFTTKPEDSGTGLGLWLVRRILDAHGATIVCDSRSGEGTTFRMVLPAVPPEASPPNAD